MEGGEEPAGSGNGSFTAQRIVEDQSMLVDWISIDWELLKDLLDE